MKSQNFQILCLLILILCTGVDALYAQEPGKKALLIGIGNYPLDGGWAAINSSNDLQLIMKALQTQGFKEENILQIKDDKATKLQILSVIKNEFMAKVNKGDIVYFHFSGHGQQRPDDNGDEVDGLDECIVPYDSPKKYQAGVYEGQNLISDDDLNKNLRQIREKIGPVGQLLVVLDACHSGTGTRGSVLARGTTEIMASKDFVTGNQKMLLKKDNNDLEKHEQTEANQKNLSPMVALFGSAQNQLNYEMTTETGEHYGSLSYALSKWIVNATPEESYRSLFDKIRVEMSTIAPLQQPQAEGQLDMQIANGKLLGKSTYYRALQVFSTTEFTINAGELHGIFSGTEVALFPSDTRDIENTPPIAKGKVTKSLPTTSTVRLDAGVEESKIKSSWIYATQKNLGTISIDLGMGKMDESISSALSQSLFVHPYIKRNQENPKLWIQQMLNTKGTSSLYVITDKEYAIDSLELPLLEQFDAVSQRFLKRIKTYLHGEFIRKMEIEGSNIKVTFKIIPLANNEGVMDVSQLKFLQLDENGIKKLPLDSRIKILIKNEGIKPAYFSLLDIQPDNIINILLPSGETSPEEMRILPNQEILIPLEFVIGSPVGNELFKLISSDKPIDLKSSLGTRGSIQKSPFEKLFAETQSDDTLRTRGGKLATLPIADLHIYSETFVITN